MSNLHPWEKKWAGPGRDFPLIPGVFTSGSDHHSDSTVNVQVRHATDESVEHSVGAVEVYLGRQNQLCSVVDDEAAGCLRAVAH